MNEIDIRTQVLDICSVLDNKKAEDILAVHVGDKTIIADWFVIASGRSTTQVKALCDELEEKTAEKGDKCDFNDTRLVHYTLGCPEKKCRKCKNCTCCEGFTC